MFKSVILSLTLFTLLHSATETNETKKGIYNQLAGEWSVTYTVGKTKYGFDINVSKSYFHNKIDSYVVDISDNKNNTYVCNYNPNSDKVFGKAFEFVCLKKNEYEKDYVNKKFMVFNIYEGEKILMGKMGTLNGNIEGLSYPIIGLKKVDGIAIVVRDIKLNQGWNLVSLPVDVEMQIQTNFEDINSTLSAFPSVPPKGVQYSYVLGDYEEIWIYDKGWIQNPGSITKEQGIWVKMKKNFISTMRGDPYLPSFIELALGWHLMGTGMRIKDINPTDCMDCAIEIVLTYNSENKEWITNPESIEIGDGFWIKKVLKQ